MKFLSLIKKEFDLEEEQLQTINNILEENKEIDHKNLLERNFDDLVYSITDELMKQPNVYEQYKVIIQNKKLITNMIKESDIDDKDLQDRYLELGKDLAYLFYNKSFKLYFSYNNTSNNANEDDSDENEKETNDNLNEELFGLTHIFFDGYKNNGEINVINSENFFVDSDEKINELRMKICDIIFIYCEKYIDLINEFAIQYIIYILVKRIYFCYYKKYEKKINSLLSEVLVNLCFFEDTPIRLISYFINRILKSTRNEDEALKKKLLKQLNEANEEEGFFYKFPKSLKHLEVIKENKKDKKDKKDKNKKSKKNKKNKKDEENEEDEED